MEVLTAYPGGEPRREARLSSSDLDQGLYSRPPDYAPPPPPHTAPLREVRANRSSTSPSSLGEEEEEEEHDLADSFEERNDHPGNRAISESAGQSRQKRGSLEKGHVSGGSAAIGQPDQKDGLHRGSSGEQQQHQQQHQQQQHQQQQQQQQAKGSGGSASDVENLTSQLLQLQTMVKEMREGFTLAMDALTKVQYGDRILEEKVDSNKVEHERQLADVVQMVLALKSEFGGMVSQLATATETQQQLRAHVEFLQYERDILLEELEQHGAVTAKVRQKYHSGRQRPNGLTRANDSTLSVLLERARSAFNANNGNSDHDSGVATCHQGDTSTCGEVTPPSVSAMVHSYIAGLPNGNHDEGTLEENYDSDSSLTAAANKSLDMSRSLGDRCAQLTNVNSSDEEDNTDQPQESTKKEHQRHTPNGPSPGYKRPASPKRTPPHEKSAKELARSRAARELLDTERKYCSCLWTILDTFANPIHEAGILPSKETSAMFPECLTRIYEHHCAFLQKLEERVAGWKWHAVIGDIFSTFIDSSDFDVLLQYRTYVTEFPAALNQLKKSCRHSLRFRKFLRKCQQDPACEGLDLGAFLLTPVQRIPRYVLLLKQMLKYTLPEHIDTCYLEACLAKLGTFLTQLNDSIEYSMKIVAGEVTPKPKRKLRVGSLRSSGSSSCEGPPLSPTKRDRGVHSASETLSLSSSSSNGRMFQLSAKKESSSQERPSSVPETGGDGPTSSSGGGGAGYDSRTLPALGSRRQRGRLQRPKSCDPRSRGSADAAESSFSEARLVGGGDDIDDSVFTAPRQPPPRPRSVIETDTSSMSDSFRAPVSSSHHIAPQWKLQESGRSNEGMSRQAAIQPPVYRGHSPAPLPVRPGLSATNVSVLSEQQSGGRVAYGQHHSSTPTATNGALHKSMSHLPYDGYGIYGNEREDSGYQPPAPAAATPADASLNRRVLKLGHRSRSQGHLAIGHKQHEELYSVPVGGAVNAPLGSASPSQPQVTVALARSLASDDRQYHGVSQSHQLRASERCSPYRQPQQKQQYQQQKEHQQSLQRPRSCALSGDLSLSAIADPDVDHSTVADDPVMRPRSASVTNGSSSAVAPLPSDGEGPEPPRENVWDDSMLDVSGLQVGRRKDGRKKKKNERHKKLEESIVSEGGRKKNGFKDSIKNIFFKKRKNDKEKIALQGILAQDSDVQATSLKIPLKTQESSFSVRSSSARSSSKERATQARGTLTGQKGQLRLEQPATAPAGTRPTGAEVGLRRSVGTKAEAVAMAAGAVPSRPQSRLKKRPHSVCYGAVTCTPQEKKSSLRAGPARSSLSSSKVVEIGPGVEYAEIGACDLDTEATSISCQAAPLHDGSVIITSRSPGGDFNTYEDENGDPCSAV